MQEARETLDEMLNTLDENKVYSVLCLMHEWQPNKQYKAGDRVFYQNSAYQVIENISSNESPKDDIQHFTMIQKPSNLINTWAEEDTPYNAVERVKIGEHIYENLIDNNIWSPRDFPAGWQLIN